MASTVGFLEGSVARTAHTTVGKSRKPTPSTGGGRSVPSSPPPPRGRWHAERRQDGRAMATRGCDPAGGRGHHPVKRGTEFPRPPPSAAGQRFTTGHCSPLQRHEQRRHSRPLTRRRRRRRRGVTHGDGQFGRAPHRQHRYYHVCRARRRPAGGRRHGGSALSLVDLPRSGGNAGTAMRKDAGRAR